jgi:O-antigen/teichoic acid export membrane protein
MSLPDPALAEPSVPSLATGTRVLTIGIASTGIFTFAYLATASHVLTPRAYSRVSLCWAVMFVILSVIYRPIEQLLSRTIAERRAQGIHGHPLRVPAALQTGFAIAFLIAALAARHPIERGMFGGSAVLYWVLVVGVLAYAGSYFARGWLAGHQEFALYGALVFLESVSRFCFALAVAVGIAHRVGGVALGMAVAPFISLAVMPFALPVVRGRLAGAPRGGSADAESASLTLRHGGGFAASVVAIMLSEQTLMNAGVLVVAASIGSTDLNGGLVGFVFNVMLIVRAPLQLFQAVQTSILPHLTGLETRRDAAGVRRAVAATVALTGGFGLAVALGLLVIGPPVMGIVLGHKGFHYQRLGLAAVGLGMGLHLIAGTLNQAALARGHAARAAVCWLLSAALFLAFQITGLIGSRVTRVEVGYCGATALLALMLWVVYAAGSDGAGGLGQRHVGGGRVRGAEHGRAGDEQVGSRAHDPR